MDPIVSKEVIFDQARAAVESGQNVHVANPYPVGTAAHAQFERNFWAWERELEAAV